MNGPELQKAVREGRRVYGIAALAVSPRWPGMLAAAGLDFVFIDTEHIALDRSQVSWQCKTYQGLDVAPIVRIPAPDPYQASAALDGGAAGVIAPYLESVEQVQQLRGAVKFRPLKGRRLEAVLAGEEELEPELAAYLEDFNRGRLMVINIESVPALNVLDELLAVPDLDAVVVGPHDLSVSMGLAEQWDHPDFNDAVVTVIRKARERRLGVGVHFSGDIRKHIDWAKAGANFVFYASDIALLEKQLRADLAHFRQELGEQASETGTGTAAGHI